MVSLEKEGYLYKQDISASRTSGRVPTNKAYEHYLENLQTNPSSIKLIQVKLDDIFERRKGDIDALLKESLEVINDSTSTLTISTDESVTNTLMDIKTYKLSEKKATIVIITSNGEVTNREVDISQMAFTEFETIVKLFSKRLIGTPISDIQNNSNSLKQVLEFQVKGLEGKFQEIINEMFAQIVRLNSKFTGMNSLISSNNLDAQTQIKTIFKMIENNSIWSLLDKKDLIHSRESGITIDIDSIDGVSMVNKEINYEGHNRKITVFGSRNQDYTKLFSMLEYLEKMIKGG